MERNEVFNKMVDICRDVFEDDSLVITEATTANDVEGWDSLTYLSLVNEMERAFKISFTLDEVTKDPSIGSLLDAIMRNING